MRRAPLLESLHTDSPAAHESQHNRNHQTPAPPVNDAHINPANMDAQVQIITTPTADTPGTTLVLSTPRRSYIFGNQAEGTQRALNEMGQRVTRVQDFFITGRTEWANIGGLIGMALTLADSSATSYESAMETFNAKKKAGHKTGLEPPKPKLNIYGPPNLKHALATSRRFIFRKGMPITATEYKSVEPVRDAEGGMPPTWEDDDVRVWTMSVTPPQAPLTPEAEAAMAEVRERYDALHNNFDDHQRPENETDEQRESRYDRIRTAVMNHMFDSNWKFDTLVERHISEVEMPTAMYLRDPVTKHISPYRGPVPGGKEPLPDIKVLTRTPWPGAMVLSLPPTTPAPESVSYIVRTRAARGKFDPQKAKAAGLKPGRAYSLLSAGESVVTEDGRTITPDMVLGPSRPGQGFALLDVPSVSYLESLLSRPEFASEKVMEGVKTFIWILGPGVAGYPLLNHFMERFANVTHTISSRDECPNRLTLDSVARQTVRLAEIDPDRYRVPVHDNASVPQAGLLGTATLKKPLVPNSLIADRGLRFRLMPEFKLLDDEIPKHVDIPTIRNETDSEILELAKSAREALEQERAKLDTWKALVARPDTEIITLGTGSALPSKYRNVSATLLRVPGVGNYLFDCGENTIGQLQRVFTADELVDVLKNLRMIWISHLHADHHLGTASVIRAWYAVVHNSVQAPMPPSMPSIADFVPMYGLAVISHSGMLQWLREYSSVEDFGYSRIVPLQITPVESGKERGSKLLYVTGVEGGHKEQVLSKKDYGTVLGLEDIQACRVAHCHGAMAVSLTFPHETSSSSSSQLQEMQGVEQMQTQTQVDKRPLKVSYSGDCRPSRDFISIGRATTVLIHEATFDDELLGDAKAKKHSTTSEALGVGAGMGANAVVLTHFSQRYQKIPVLETVGNSEDTEAVDPSKVETEQPDPVEEGLDEEGVEEDVDMGNMDMTRTNTRSANSTSPSSTATPAAPTNKTAPAPAGEKVIKIRARDMKVAVAFDYMRVRIGAIAELEKFNPALNALLCEDEVDAIEAPMTKEVVVGEGKKEKKQKQKQKGKDGKEGKGKGEGGEEVKNGNGKRPSSSPRGKEETKKRSVRNN